MILAVSNVRARNGWASPPAHTPGSLGDGMMIVLNSSLVLGSAGSIDGRPALLSSLVVSLPIGTV